MTTLTCGHPPGYGYARGHGCALCESDPEAVRAYAANLCGLDAVRDHHADRPAAPLPFAVAVVAEPDSPVPKLVLADWLTDQGDDRGELIRVECELAGNEWATILLNTECPYWEFSGRRAGPDRCACNVCEHYNALSDRRAALRRQLGYDRPADAVCYRCRLGYGPDPDPECPRCGGTGRVAESA